MEHLSVDLFLVTARQNFVKNFDDEISVVWGLRCFQVLLEKMGNLGLLVTEININLDKREKLIKKWKRFSLLQISRNSVNICIKLIKKSVTQVIYFFNFFAVFFYFCLFIYFGRRDFFRWFISWITSRYKSDHR